MYGWNDPMGRGFIPRLPFRTHLDRFQRRYVPYLFVSPFFILFGIFGLFPILFSIYLSFQAWNPVQGLGTMVFVGSRTTASC